MTAGHPEISFWVTPAPLISAPELIDAVAVPAPLPLLGLACGFAATRRLRRRVLQNQGQHRAP